MTEVGDATEVTTADEETHPAPPQSPIRDAEWLGEVEKRVDVGTG